MNVFSNVRSKRTPQSLWAWMLVLLWGMTACDPSSTGSKARLASIETPDYAFSILGEAMAFEAKGSKGTSFTDSVDVRKLAQYVKEFEELLVYEIQPNGKVSKLEHQFLKGFMRAKFTAGSQYVIYPVSLDLRLRNTYEALCGFRYLGNIGRLAPGITDRICWVILCSNDMIRAADVIREIPEFREFENDLPFSPEMEFGGYGAPTRQVGFGNGNLCDRCFGMGRDIIIPSENCEPPGEITPPPPPPSVTVVNMVPVGNSAETNQDSEPFLAVDLSEPANVVGSAFTPNPFGPAAGTAPVYVSTDSGQTWVLNNIVQSAGARGTGDITIATSNDPDELFGGILRRPAAGLLMDALQADDFNTNTLMTRDLSQNGPDQPYIQSSQNADQRVYLAANNTAVMPNPTAAMYVSDDGGTTYTQTLLDPRTVSSQNGPSVRQAISRDGVAYAAYFGQWTRNGSIRTVNVVVARDDDGGVGATPFTDLTDPSDGLAGRLVATDVDIRWVTRNSIGQERTGSHLSLAVHPTNSNIVYVAWADTGLTGDINTLHLRRSRDGGQTWSRDLRMIRNAIAPTIAISDNGAVAFMYQALNDGNWITRVEQSRNGFDDRTVSTLSRTPAATPVATGWPYLGDYAYMTAVDGEFWGVFSANNTPNNANFPSGVIYQRNADFTTNTLNDGAGGNVAISIDPFFFRVSRID